MPDIKKKELEVLSKHFENLVQDFTSNNKINLSRDKSQRIQNFLKELGINPIIDNHTDIISALLNNFDVQLENIYLQSAIILDFFNLLKKLEKKPDDTKLLQAIVELKKNLGLI